jgi:membrane-associated protein
VVRVIVQAAADLVTAGQDSVTNLALLPGFLDPVNLLNSFGTWVLVGLLLVVFIESGLLFPLLPGDSLLFTAGLIAASKSTEVEPFAPLWVLLVTIPIAAFLGDQVGYWIGAKGGAALFKSNDAKFFKKSYIDESHAFFEKHGPITIFLARFVPIVRTFAPVLAGVGEMPYRIFFRYNVIGGFLWAVGVTTAGYVLGSTIPSIDKYLLPIIFVIVLFSVVPPALEYRKHRKAAGATTDPAPLSEADARTEQQELEDLLDGED